MAGSSKLSESFLQYARGCVCARACLCGCAHALILKSVCVSVRNYFIGVSRNNARMIWIHKSAALWEAGVNVCRLFFRSVGFVKVTKLLLRKLPSICPLGYVGGWVGSSAPETQSVVSPLLSLTLAGARFYILSSWISLFLGEGRKAMPCPAFCSKANLDIPSSVISSA